MTAEPPALAEFLLARCAEDEQRAREDLARVLVEVESRRRVIEEYAYWREKVLQSARAGAIPQHDLYGRFEVASTMLRALATADVGHPDYREEWRL